jgi:hypothetical protein
MATAEAYCVKCRAKREIKDPQQVTMKNGRPAMKGSCPVCGTALFRIGGGEGSSSSSGSGAAAGGSKGKGKSKGSDSGS